MRENKSGQSSRRKCTSEGCRMSSSRKAAVIEDATHTTDVGCALLEKLWEKKSGQSSRRKCTSEGGHRTRGHSAETSELPATK